MEITLILYLILSVYTSFFAWMTSKGNNVLNKKFLGFITILIPSVFSAIRYGVGTDYFNYVSIFKGTFNRESFELGFELLTGVARSLTTIPSIYFFIMTLIMMFFILKGILYYKADINIGISMFVFMMFFYFQSFNATRQMIAVAITFYAFEYVHEKRPLLFTFFTLLATSFHLSSLIILPFYFVFNNNFFTKKKAIRFIFIFLVIIVFMNLDTIALFASSFINMRLVYFERSDVNMLNFSSIIKYSPVILSYIYVYRRKLISNFQLYNSLFIVFLSGVLLLVIGSLYVSTAIYRISLPMTIYLIILIPLLIRKLSLNNKRILSFLLFFYIISFFYYEFFLIGNHRVVPYITIFDI